MVIKTKKHIGKCELFTMHFYPILYALLSDPNKSVLLRCPSIKADETGDMRPDIIISKLSQCNFEPSI
ncbi:hypothetical protein CLU79DRAFT_703299 [Phycomyces nitens]|nr:hypothetical protein CLU79DRAFT_703299 [Phycomyces nitens]